MFGFYNPLKSPQKSKKSVAEATLKKHLLQTFCDENFIVWKTQAYDKEACVFIKRQKATLGFSKLKNTIKFSSQDDYII